MVPHLSLFSLSLEFFLFLSLFPKFLLGLPLSLKPRLLLYSTLSFTFPLCFKTTSLFFTNLLSLYIKFVRIDHIKIDHVCTHRNYLQVLWIFFKCSLFYRIFINITMWHYCSRESEIHSPSSLFMARAFLLHLLRSLLIRRRLSR